MATNQWNAPRMEIFFSFLWMGEDGGGGGGGGLFGILAKTNRHGRLGNDSSENEYFK